MKTTKTQQRLADRLGIGNSYTSKKYGRDHVMAAGKAESNAAIKMGLIYVLDVPGCGAIFRKPK